MEPFNDDFYSLEKIFNIVTQEEQRMTLMVGRDDRTETAMTYAVNHCDKF